jgi:hypothetical protein
MMDRHRLRALAQTDTEAFEQTRNDLIEDFFQGVPSSRHLHLRRLQFRIEGLMRRKGPIGGLIALEGLMSERLQELSAAIEGEAETQPGPAAPDNLLPFPRRPRER